MTDPLFSEYKDAETMAESLAARISGGLKKAIELRGKAGLIVSGGSTPLALFDCLAQTDIPWDKVTITLADERVVDDVHADSNARLVRSRLLQAYAGDAHFISLLDHNLPPDDRLADTQKRLRAFPWPSVFTVLGMGNDGHTASLFPGADDLAKALDMKTLDRARVLSPRPLPVEAPYQRITLTLPTLLESSHILLMIKGSDKRHTYEAALSGSSIADMPVRAILHQNQVPVETHWAP